MPERGARMPTRNGLFCAMAGLNTRPDADTTPTAAADASRLRRVTGMVSSLVTRVGVVRFLLIDRSMTYQTHVSNRTASPYDWCVTSVVIPIVVARVPGAAQRVFAVRCRPGTAASYSALVAVPDQRCSTLCCTASGTSNMTRPSETGN